MRYREVIYTVCYIDKEPQVVSTRRCQLPCLHTTGVLIQSQHKLAANRPRDTSEVVNLRRTPNPELSTKSTASIFVGECDRKHNDMNFTRCQWPCPVKRHHQSADQLLFSAH
ncbi:hypothetical protein NP493_172g03025 [Ridgeia piscesae]|uniref:Uncharacterized protein n=1 Tax=Ridgeia piscesae TaxID=27915 RepID=A0AAD9UFC3_RIDPI|nr:hypothetical protein NP493_172g03025 [Ridgeia piscesae]